MLDQKAPFISLVIQSGSGSQDENFYTLTIDRKQALKRLSGNSLERFTLFISFPSSSGLGIIPINAFLSTIQNDQVFRSQEVVGKTIGEIAESHN